MNADEVSIADVNELWRIGAVDLPTVAAQYSEAASQIHRTALNDSAMFTTSDGLSALHDPFTQVRDLLQDQVFVKSSQRCGTAGKAVTQIADSFATADYLNSRDLQRYEDYKEDRETGSPEDQPPYVPPPPKSTDPHPEENVYDYPGPPR